MPLYEYVCETDGTVIELLRASERADDPVEDPAGLGRVFRRRWSTFAAATGASLGASAGRLTVPAGCCPCGKTRGACGA